MDEDEKNLRLVKAFAKRLDVKPAARAKWWQRGVPHWARLPILHEAAKQGIVLPLSAFEARKR